MINPYAIKDQWLEFHDENEYETYLKCQIWHTDGKDVMLVSSYKEVPYPIYFESSEQYSVKWMLPSGKPDEKNPPQISNHFERKV